MLKYNFNAVRRRKGRQWESTVIQVRDGNEIVSDSEEGGNSADDDNEGYTDRTWQPIARAHVTNLKGVSKLDKPAGKSKFTVQAGIIATVKHQNYFLELFVLFITMGLVEVIVKKWTDETSGGGLLERESPTIPFQEVLLKPVCAYCSKKSLLMTPDYPGIMLYKTCTSSEMFLFFG